MRTVLTAITAFVMTGILGPAVIVAELFGAREGPGSFYQWVMHVWSRAINVASGVRVRVHNPERLPDVTEGVVYVGNHVSWLDITALAAVLPRYSFIAKSELRRIPVFGWAAASAGIVFLDRDNRKSAFEAYRGAADQVRGGRSVIVFPEGTRGDDYHLRSFKKGPFVLAIAAQARVVPTLIYGTREVLPRGSWNVRRGVVDVYLLPAVSTAGMTYDDRHALMQSVWGEMADAMREHHGIGTDEYPIAGARGA